MTEIDNMLKQLQSGLKQLNTSKKALYKISTNLIANIPEDKRAEASALMNKARKGKVNIDELMNFAGSMSKEDKDNLEKSVDMVDKKSEEVKKK